MVHMQGCIENTTVFKEEYFSLFAEDHMGKLQGYLK